MKNKKEIELIIEGEEWTKALDKAFKIKNKDVKIEGFRTGMAPKDIFIKKMGIESLYMDAVDIVMESAYEKALKDADITPVIEPNIDVTNINEKAVTFKFTFIGKPEITLGEYKNLKIKKEEAKVSKEEIEDEIAKLQNQLAEITPKEKGKVEKGNTAVIDFEGLINGKPLEGGAGTNYPLEIGSNTFIPGFEDGIIGMEIGETKELNLKFPADYIEDLKNKEVKFTVTVREIKERVIPTINEDFYKDLGFENIKTEEDFRKEVESVILDRKNAEIEDAFIEECLETASKNMKVEINPEIISEEVHRMIHQFEEQLKMQGIKIDDYMGIVGLTHEKLHEQMEPEAIKRIKYRYLLDEIATKENIEFTDKEVDERAKEMADNYGITVDELIKSYGSKDIVKYDMKMHKAIEILRDNN